MKKYLVLALMTALSTPAFANFTGPSTAITTVAEANTAADDTFVELTGNILRSLGNETYLFKDHTGEIVIEIDQEDWLGQQVGPEDKVKIRGEVDTEWTKREIDVSSIQKL